MKIIAVDNFARETVADRLVAENIKSHDEARIMLEALQATCVSGGPTWYIIADDNRRLSRGLEDFLV